VVAALTCLRGGQKALIKRNIRFTKDLERLPVAGGPGKKRKLSAATAVWRKI